jgi:DNA polymerase-3 subunit delta
MDALLSSGDIDHPLQLLSAMLKQFRSLVMIKDFIESSYGGSWHSGDSFSRFKTRVMPAIQAFDKNVLDQLKGWEERASDHEDSGTRQEKKQQSETKTLSKGQATTDLVIAKNPNNPYPVYQMLKKSERFTKQEIVAALERLRDADLRLKSTGQNQKIVMEDLILNICGRA